jgi:hypothetical protein
MTSPAYFYLERYRPGRLYYFVAGIVGVFALGVVAPPGAPLFLGVIVCGALLVAGAPAILGGSTWESCITGGRVHWVRPGRLWGHWDSCPVEDVTELRFRTSATGLPNATMHVLVLKNGTERSIDYRCIGDAAAFAQALQKENPKIHIAAETR